ncbi:MAG: hypothetical protein EBQ96_02875 [Proteobacteria bacterium]|nr:hypothetical protein [Pseudomonadota bacterium]
MFIRTLQLACMALIFFAFIPATQAQESGTDDTDIIGTILEVEGEATVAQAGKEARPATVNTQVRTGDTLTTGPQSRLYVMLIDQTELTLSENGQLVLDEYFFDDTNSVDNNATYSVAKGAFLYVSGLVAKKENPEVTVNIPSGSIGIRGTRFWGGELDGEYGVLVGDGEVEIDTGAQNKTVLKKGQGTTLRGRGVVPDPVKVWGKQKIDRAVNTVALKRPEIVGKRIEVEKSQRQKYLLERHKIHQFRAMEKIRTEIETANPELKGKLTRRDLLKMYKEKKASGGAQDDGHSKENAPNRKEKSEMKRELLRDKAEQKRETLRGKAETARDTMRERAETIRDNIREQAEEKRLEGGTIERPKIEALKEVTTQSTEPVREIAKPEIAPVEKVMNPTVPPVIRKMDPIAKPIIDKQP